MTLVLLSIQAPSFQHTSSQCCTHKFQLVKHLVCFHAHQLMVMKVPVGPTFYHIVSYLQCNMITSSGTFLGECRLQILKCVYDYLGHNDPRGFHLSRNIGNTSGMFKDSKAYLPTVPILKGQPAFGVLKSEKKRTVPLSGNLCDSKLSCINNNHDTKNDKQFIKNYCSVFSNPF